MLASGSNDTTLASCQLFVLAVVLSGFTLGIALAGSNGGEKQQANTAGDGKAGHRIVQSGWPQDSFVT